MERPLFLPAVTRWFARLGSPTRIQLDAWEALKGGGHAVLCAPTGAGKTLAAFLCVLDDLYRRSLAGSLGPGARVLYISPLKALSNDVEKNLSQPLAGIAEELRLEGLSCEPITAMVRTGDTTQSRRAKMLKDKPHIVVTTPESLYVLLTSERGRELLRTIETVIVDEIHAILSSRRGAHLSLSLERLEALAGRPLQRIGVSATVRPLSLVADFLAAGRDVRIVHDAAPRPLDIKMILPDRPLDAVMTQEGWQEINTKILAAAESCRTALIFVNNRRLCERLARQLSDLIGQDRVGAHHGSLSQKKRHEAEQALKAGALKIMVATSSLELGIDIGSIDLVIQIASPRSVHAFLQRIGRSEHHKDGVSRAVLVPLTRDDLVECTALLRSVRQGLLETAAVEPGPVDILAQQIVAEAACRPMSMTEALALFRRAYPYRSLTAEALQDIVRMLSEGYSLRFGRRARYVFFDAQSGRLEGRPGARLAAITNGGAIADNFEYEVILENEGVFLGTVHEDFAIESMAGDVFQLGNQFWRITRVSNAKVLVQPAPGSTPTMPFWIAEAPGRSDLLSSAVSSLRSDSAVQMSRGLEGFAEWLEEEAGVGGAAAAAIFEYFREALQALGTMPTQQIIVLERFFDETGDCHLVLHSPFGTRINRAWGLALRKRFCRKFNFELQAAATDDAVLFSLSKTHSFALGEVFQYLKSGVVEKILVQALLAAPMFEIRWRWNASRALAILRQYGGRRTPPQIQKNQAQDLVALVFPDQIACAENLAGDREVPDHPLVQQTIADCLHEAMDLPGLKALLAGLEEGRIKTHTVDSPAPSLFAHEIVGARPYAFLDDAPLEERRTRAVRTDMQAGVFEPLPVDLIEQIRSEILPPARSAAELLDRLVSRGMVPAAAFESPFLSELFASGRAAEMQIGGRDFIIDPLVRSGIENLLRGVEERGVLDLILRGIFETEGPLSREELLQPAPFPEGLVSAALVRYEQEGWLFVIEGDVRTYCERSFLARLRHRSRTRREDFSLARYSLFLRSWQHAAGEFRLTGEAGLSAVLEQLQGLEMSFEEWHSVLSLRVTDYTPRMLDAMFLSGRFLWARSPGPSPARKTITRRVPVMILSRQNKGLLPPCDPGTLSHYAETVRAFMLQRGAVFFDELSGAGLFEDHLIWGMKELVARGLLTADSAAALDRLFPDRKRRMRRGPGISAAGRWSLLLPAREEDNEMELARILLARYGVLFRYIAEREKLRAGWPGLVRTLRRLEMQGEVRGGRFVRDAWGEQFALPQALSLLKETPDKSPDVGAPALTRNDPARAAEYLMTPAKEPR